MPIIIYHLCYIEGDTKHRFYSDYDLDRITLVAKQYARDMGKDIYIEKIEMPGEEGTLPQINITITPKEEGS